MAKKQTSKNTNWCYDKQGNVKEIPQPTNNKGKVMPVSKTTTGSLLGGIGFGGVIGKNIR